MTDTSRAIRGVRLWSVLAAIVVVVALAASRWDIAVQLLFGWVNFLSDVLPKVHVRWDGVAVFSVGIAVMTCVAHYLLAWIVRERNARRSADAPLVWRFRSSFGLVVLGLLIFVVGIAMTGVVHQAAWLATDPDPMYVGRVQSPADSAQSVYRPGNVSGELGTSWIMKTLPYMPVMQPDFDPSQPWNAPVNAPGFKKLVPVTLCPSQGNPLWSPDGYGLSQVAASEEFFTSRQRLPRRLPESGSRKFMIGETNAAFVPWGEPRGDRSASLGLRRHWAGVPRGKVGFGSVHSSGTNFCMDDASVLSVSNAIDLRVLEQLSK